MNPKVALRELTFDEIVEYLTTKKVSHICPCCGADQNVVQPGSKSLNDIGFFVTNSVAIKHENGENKLTQVQQSGVVAIMTECVNCGYLRSFSVNKILEFFKNKAQQ